MAEKAMVQIFKNAGALVENDHVVYASGLHGSTYINKDAIYSDPRVVSELCRYLSGEFDGRYIDTVLGPAIGGIIMAQWVAYHLSNSRDNEVAAVYAEKDGQGGFALRRGYDKDIATGKVLIVEDILTTGSSVRKLVELTRAMGGRVVGVAALWNRGGVTAKGLGVSKLVSLIKRPLEAWPADACPLCVKGIRVNIRLGKGSK